MLKPKYKGCLERVNIFTPIPEDPLWNTETTKKRKKASGKLQTQHLQVFKRQKQILPTDDWEFLHLSMRYLSNTPLHIDVGHQIAGRNIWRCYLCQLAGMSWRWKLELCALSRVGAAPTHSTLFIDQLLGVAMIWLIIVSVGDWWCTTLYTIFNWSIIIAMAK